jgi:hypothetical protein
MKSEEAIIKEFRERFTDKWSNADITPLCITAQLIDE